jgi:hypothetical protein
MESIATKLIALAILTVVITVGCDKPTPTNVNLLNAAGMPRINVRGEKTEANHTFNEGAPEEVFSALGTPTTSKDSKLVNSLIKGTAEANSRNRDEQATLHDAGFISRKEIVLALLANETRSSRVYEIPEGFTGWVLIEFGKTNSTPLRMKDGKIVVEISNKGRCCTSSTLDFGWAEDSYFYVGKTRSKLPSTAPNGGGLIWGGGTSSVHTKGPEKTYETFFVGTEQQFTAAGPSPPLESMPLIPNH